MKIPVILGPTGVGKSGFAVNLAKLIGGEIISADSCQVYKEFNIGSAKITKDEMQEVPHYLIDVLNPTQSFNAAIFQKMANEKIEEILKKGKVPIICGGTGLYIKGLILGYDFNSTQRDDKLRNEYEQIIETKGVQYLYEMLVEKNSELAKNINPNDKTRIIRALETNSVAKLNKPKFEFQIFCIDLDRELLYKKINKRVDEMVKEGLFEEVESLIKKYGYNLQAFSSIGYKEIVAFFKEELSKERAIELIKQHSRNYAKRQMTFIRGFENVKYIKKEDLKEIAKLYENN